MTLGCCKESNQGSFLFLYINFYEALERVLFFCQKSRGSNYPCSEELPFRADSMRERGEVICVPGGTEAGDSRQNSMK